MGLKSRAVATLQLATLVHLSTLRSYTVYDVCEYEKASREVSTYVSAAEPISPVDCRTSYPHLHTIGDNDPTSIECAKRIP